MEKYLVSDIKKMIRESIEEASLGKVRPGAIKPSTAAPTQIPQGQSGVKQSTTSSDEGKYFPVVSYCYRKNDGENGESIVHLGLAYVYDQHVPILQKMYSKMGGIFSVVKKGKSIVELDINDANLDSFKKIIPTFQEILKRATTLTHNAKYDEKKLEELGTDITNALDATPTLEELEAYNSLVAKNWREMMNAVNDPNIKSRVKSLGAFYISNNGDETIDHRLTDRNKAIILAQDPSATYVTQKVAWEQKFNRTIVDENKFILVNYPNNKVVTKDIKEQVARKFGYGTYDNYKKLKRAGTVQRGRIHSFEMECQKRAQGFAFTYFIKMYDIANTQLMPGAEDIFETQEGYVNNLFGVPNDLANTNKAVIDASAKQAQTNAPLLQTDRTDTMLQNCLYIAIKACRNEGIPFKESGNIPEDIGGAIYEYEIKRADSTYHIPNPAARKTFAQSIAAAVSVSLGLENAIMSAFYNDHGDMTDKEAQDAYGEFNGFVAAFSSKEGREAGNATVTPLKMVNETMNENINDFNGFKNFLLKSGVNIINNEEMNDDITSQMMEESFFEMYDKLERL